MIQVTANKTNDLHDKGEIVTKLNERGEEVLRQQLTHRLYTLKNSPVFKSLEHTSYADTLGVYVALFGDRPYGH
jgi:hypothetical protein